MHAPSQEVLQQTPWAQIPERHWMPELHSAPFGLLPHEPFMQMLGGTQSVGFEQLVGQVLPLHT